jgi:hypothetical protein
MYIVEVSVYVRGNGFTSNVSKTVSAKQIREGIFPSQELNQAIIEGKQQLLKHGSVGYHFSAVTGSYRKRNKVEYSIGIFPCK